MAKEPGGEKNIKAARDAEKSGNLGKLRDLQQLWFLEDDDNKAAQLADQAIKNWQAVDQRRIWDYGWLASLYGHAELLGFSGSLQAREFSQVAPIVNPLAATFNGCQSCVDTLANSICQHKPVVQFAASDGDWKSHRIAKMRTRFIAGWLAEQEIYKKLAIQFRDSGVWGRGILHVFARHGRAVCERVFPGDLFVNQASCYTNNRPLEMGRTHLVDRREAFENYAGDEQAQDAIRRADQYKVTIQGLFTDKDDLIILNELWRLPSHHGAGDGQHIIATTKQTVIREEWKHDNFPFAFIDCTERLFGFWPQGLVEQLSNLQLQYNELAYSINDAIETAGRFRLFLSSDSNVNPESVGNDSGDFIRGDKPPMSLLWQIVQPEVYARLEKLERQFYTQSGISQMVAAPDPERDDPGASGIAIRSRVAIYDERHALWEQSYQNAPVTLARLAIQTIGDILEKEGDEGEKSYTVYPTKGPQSEPIDFADLAFEPDEQYTLKAMPVGELPEKVEGRIALAEQFVQNGYYDEATARQVFLEPYDVDRVETLFNASYDYFSKILDAAVEHGEECPDPEANDQLALALKLALQQLAYAKNRGVSEGRCDILRRYIMKVKARIQELAAAGAPAPAASPGQPLANPQSPPTSTLLPNPNAPSAQAA